MSSKNLNMICCVMLSFNDYVLYAKKWIPRQEGRLNALVMMMTITFGGNDNVMSAKTTLFDSIM